MATPAQVVDETTKEINGYVAPFRALQRGLLLVTLVAVVATLLLVGVQRRRELGVLAAVGMSPGRLAGLTLTEATLTAVVASTLASLAIVPMGAALTDGLLFLIGARAPFSFHVPPTAAYAAFTLAIVIAGASLPAWQMSRLPVVEALQYE